MLVSNSAVSYDITGNVLACLNAAVCAEIECVISRYGKSVFAYLIKSLKRYEAILSVIFVADERLCTIDAFNSAESVMYADIAY